MGILDWLKGQSIEIPESWDRCEIHGFRGPLQPLTDHLAFCGVAVMSTTNIITITPVQDSNGKKIPPEKNFPKVLGELIKENQETEILWY